MSKYADNFNEALATTAGATVGVLGTVYLANKLPEWAKNAWQVVSDPNFWRTAYPDDFDALVMDDIRPLGFYSQAGLRRFNDWQLSVTERLRIAGKMAQEISLPSLSLATLVSSSSVARRRSNKSGRSRKYLSPVARKRKSRDKRRGSSGLPLLLPPPAEASTPEQIESAAPEPKVEKIKKAHRGRAPQSLDKKRTLPRLLFFSKLRIEQELPYGPALMRTALEFHPAEKGRGVFKLRLVKLIDLHLQGGRDAKVLYRFIRKHKN